MLSHLSEYFFVSFKLFEIYHFRGWFLLSTTSIIVSPTREKFIVKFLRSGRVGGRILAVRFSNAIWHMLSFCCQCRSVVQKFSSNPNECIQTRLLHSRKWPGIRRHTRHELQTRSPFVCTKQDPAPWVRTTSCTGKEHPRKDMIQPVASK